MEKTRTLLAEPTLPPASYSCMVLLVDDQEMVAEALRRLLSDRPEVDLHYCADPIEAIRVANEVKPTVILQDWVMPSIDGLDLLRLFRANPSTAETPIIILSSEESPETKSRAFSAGANDYLIKLPDKVELLARVQYHSKAHLSRLQRDEAFRTLRESQQKLSESNVALISVNRRLEETHQQLNTALQQAKQRAREAVRLTELMDVLQSCQTVNEGYEVTGTTMPNILPSRAGALCITSPSRDLVEAVANWGQNCGTEKTFVPNSCWALRRGRIHVVNDPNSPLRCSHVKNSPVDGYICIPLAAQGETLGVLYVESLPQDTNASAKQVDTALDVLSREAVSAGERISLALANLRLREVLRSQSIRDPLTGLFNRRYMEETLEREIQRALRNKEQVALLMIDIDHFKPFNDTFGHPAGDTVLRELGTLLNQRTRGQDVACRFGGEEFAVILAGASSEAAVVRAEHLCQEVRKLAVAYKGQTLGKISLSIGISSYPGKGSNAEELVHTADEALYRAKTEGRDRVAIAKNLGTLEGANRK
jgi:diguanylate cyclase (GGDEF)-like protein